MADNNNKVLHKSIFSQLVGDGINSAIRTGYYTSGSADRMYEMVPVIEIAPIKAEFVGRGRAELLAEFNQRSIYSTGFNENDVRIFSQLDVTTALQLAKTIRSVMNPNDPLDAGLVMLAKGNDKVNANIQVVMTEDNDGVKLEITKDTSEKEMTIDFCFIEENVHNGWDVAGNEIFTKSNPNLNAFLSFLDQTPLLNAPNRSIVEGVLFHSAAATSTPSGGGGVVSSKVSRNSRGTTSAPAPAEQKTAESAKELLSSEMDGMFEEPES